MKKRLQGLVAGVLIGATVVGCTVFADGFTKTAELFYNNVKIFIDGAEIVPKDANGNVVEPFILNGTTYLPVRAVANAFGKDVEWDGVNARVYIGKKDQTKPDNYLDKIQYNDYKEGYDDSWLNIINGTVTDFNGNNYTNGLLLYNRKSNGIIEDDIDEANLSVSYPLNSQYSSMTGKIVLPKKYDITTGKKDNCDVSESDVWFYGDGKLLYKATGVNASMPFNIDINTRGVNQLVVKAKTEGHWSMIALTDLALYK